MPTHGEFVNWDGARYGNPQRACWNSLLATPYATVTSAILVTSPRGCDLAKNHAAKQIKVEFTAVSQ